MMTCSKQDQSLSNHHFRVHYFRFVLHMDPAPIRPNTFRSSKLQGPWMMLMPTSAPYNPHSHARDTLIRGPEQTVSVGLRRAGTAGESREP